MVRYIDWPQSRGRGWLLLLITLVAITALWGSWASRRTPGDRFWILQAWWIAYLPAFNLYWVRAPLHILTDGALAIWDGNAASSRVIPLGKAEVLKRRKGIVALRWWDGRKYRRESLYLPPRLAGELEQAVPEARGNPDAPRTVEQAAHAVRLALSWLPSGRQALFLAAILVPVGLALLFNQPFWLAPLLGLAFADRWMPRRSAALLGSELLLLAPGTPAVHLTLAELHIRAEGNLVEITTNDPGVPAMRFSRRAFPAFVSSLMARTAGMPDPPPPAPDPPRGAATGDPLRCSLCGRTIEPNPGAPVQGQTVICPQCDNRIRMEAQNAGHGFAGRESPPM